MTAERVNEQPEDVGQEAAQQAADELTAGIDQSQQALETGQEEPQYLTGTEWQRREAVLQQQMQEAIGTATRQAVQESRQAMNKLLAESRRRTNQTAALLTKYGGSLEPEQQQQFREDLERFGASQEPEAQPGQPGAQAGQQAPAQDEAATFLRTWQQKLLAEVTRYATEQGVNPQDARLRQGLRPDMNLPEWIRQYTDNVTAIKQAASRPAQGTPQRQGQGQRQSASPPVEGGPAAEGAATEDSLMDALLTGKLTPTQYQQRMAGINKSA